MVQINNGALVSPNAPTSTPNSYSPLLSAGQSAFPAQTPVSFGVPPTPSTATKTVVTAKPAIADLAAKKANVDTAAAVQQTPPAAQPTQTAAVQPSAQTPVPQPATPSTPAKAAVPPGATQQQILDLLQGGDVSLTQDQVKQIAGMDFTGFQQNPDGTFSPDSSAVSRVEAQNNYAPTPTADNGDQVASYIQQQHANLDAEAQQNYTNYTQQLQQLQQLSNGSFPLTAGQQSQVSALQQQFASALQQQQEANANYVGAVTLLGIRAGTSRYVPGIAQRDIQNAVSSGVSKIMALNAQAAQAMTTLQQSFQDNDYKTINAQYSALQDLMKQKDNTLQEMQQNVKDQLDAQTQKLAQQKSLLDIETTTVNNVAQAALDTALKPDGTLDLDKIQGTADEYGVDVNQLYSAVLKQKDAATLQQQQDTKFQSDQAQAAAQLANTKANTAKTYNDIATAKSAAAGSPIDTSALNANQTAALTANGFSSYSSSTQGLAQQLVNGQLAPSELSKRTTGSSSYSDILNAANAYSEATTGKPFNIANADRDYKFANNAQTQNTLNYLKGLVGTSDGKGNLSGGNLDSLVTQSNGIARTSFPALNDAAAWARLSSGDPAIASYYATVTEVADQVAKVLQGGGTGSGTSDAKLAQASALFQSGFSKAQISGIATTLKGLLQNRATAIVGDNAYLSDYASDFGINQGGEGDTSDSGFTPRGSTAAPDFVANTFASLYPGKSEQDIVSQYSSSLQDGEQLAFDNTTGAIVAATKDDIDSGNYTPL